MSRTRTLLSVLAAGSASLDKNLTFVGHSWYTGDNPDVGNVHVRAPRGFEMTTTATGQGRFNDDTRTWVLGVEPVHEEAYVADLMRERERELAGLRDLEIVEDSVTIDGESRRLATVTYRYTNAAGEARLVRTRYVAGPPYESARNEYYAYAEMTVAGRPQDRPGLNAMMRTATRSLYFPG